MKKTLAPTLLVVALVGFSGGAALGTDIQKPVTADSPGSPNPETRQQRQLSNLMQRFEKVGLTEDQKNQIRPLLRSQLEELRAVRMDTNLSDEVRQLRARSILDVYRTQIASVLSPQQKVQLEQLREANIKAARDAGTIKKRGRPIEDNN